MKVLALAAAMSFAALSGCSTSQSASTPLEGGYVAGDGSVVVLPDSQRGDAVNFTGTTTRGDKVSSADFLGAPLVLNTWFAACGPCRVEASELADAARSLDGDVAFLGINTSDGDAQAVAFEEQFAVPYASILDRNGRTLLALRGELSPAATPTTLVIDADGRVAARISGATDSATIRGIIEVI